MVAIRCKTSLIIKNFARVEQPLDELHGPNIYTDDEKEKKCQMCIFGGGPVFLGIKTYITSAYLMEYKCIVVGEFLMVVKHLAFGADP